MGVDTVDELASRYQWERARAVKAEAERDRLRAEVAALRAAWPEVIEGEGGPRGAVFRRLNSANWAAVGYPAPHPSRDAAIDAAAGLHSDA